MNIVGVGIGGKGHVNLKGMATENIIGLCDVDWKYADICFKDFPGAKSTGTGVKCSMNWETQLTE